MRLLHIHSGNLYGGVETLLSTLHRFPAPGHHLEHDFALCFAGPLKTHLMQQGARIWNLGPVRARNPWSVWRARRRIREVVDQGRFDAVITHMSWCHALLGSTIRHSGIPLVNWQHNPARGGHWTERWASRTLPNLVLANSVFVAKTMHSIFPDVPVRVLHCPVAPIEAKRKDPGNPVVILLASRFAPWKGHATLFKALQRLLDLPNWICWVAGAPQNRQEAHFERALRKSTQEWGLSSRVRFLGYRDDVPALLSHAGIYCQPNEAPEPFGISYVEAMWSGTPVVASRSGGAAEIISPHCGLLTTPGDERALSEALRLLVTSSQLRERLGAQGPARARFISDPEQQSRRLYELLAGVLYPGQGALLP